MKSTIVDVAKKAKVSIATVSRVINGNYPVKEETREKVLAAIRSLKYIPNMQARELNMQTSTIIGVVVPSIYNMFFAEVMHGIEEYLSSDAYSLMFCCSKNDSKLEMQCINDFIARNVAGIIVISPHTENLENTFYERIARQIPLVFINSYAKHPNISYVSNDEDTGTRLALNYLLEHDHKDILFIRGEHSDSYDIKEQAYVDIMKRRHCFHESYMLNIGDGNSNETVDHTMQKVLEILPSTNATAVFACNDLMAAGVVNACKKLNIAIPKELSIIGYDNIALSRFIEPKLTTVEQNMFQLGNQAAQLILEKIMSHNQLSKRVVLENSLVVRESVGVCSR